MNIYYVANVKMPTPKAHGIQLAKMCEGFIESGHSVELLVPQLSHTKSASAATYYGLRTPLTVTTVPVVSFSGALGFNIRALTFAISAFIKLYLRKLPKGSIVYSIDLDQFSFFLLPFLHLPFVMEVHGSKRNSVFTRFAFRRANAIIAVSAAVKASLMATFGCPAEKITVCPNGIDPEMFQNVLGGADARKKLGLPLGYTLFLYVGRFYDWKGLDVLPKAAHLLGARGGIYLVGGTTEQFIQVTGNLFPPSNLVCMGSRPFGEIPLWLSAADFLLVTATKKDEYSYRETSPMKLFEYMAARRPVIAADTPAIRSVVSEDEVLFYEPDSADSLINAMKFAEVNKGILAAKADRAYRKTLDFTWKKRAERIITVFPKTI